MAKEHGLQRGPTPFRHQARRKLTSTCPMRSNRFLGFSFTIRQSGWETGALFLPSIGEASASFQKTSERPNTIHERALTSRPAPAHGLHP